MRNLQKMKDEAQTKLFEEIGAFWAFNDQQFLDSKKDGIKYNPLGHGLYCPAGKARALIDGLEEISKAARAEDLKQNSKYDIIKRALANHECYYLMDWEPAKASLIGYNFTDDEIREVFNKECAEINWDTY